jgi:hypothetical protein
MTPSAIATRPQSNFLRDLRGPVSSQLAGEMDLTLRVGVMTAGGLTRTDIITGLQHAGLDVDELDVKMAIRRLGKIATHWRAER